jgi:hypothetical protein
MSAGLRKMKRSARASSVTRSRRESVSTPVMPSALSKVRAGSSNRPLGSASVSTALMSAPA